MMARMEGEGGRAEEGLPPSTSQLVQLEVEILATGLETPEASATSNAAEARCIAIAVADQPLADYITLCLAARPGLQVSTPDRAPELLITDAASADGMGAFPSIPVLLVVDESLDAARLAGIRARAPLAILAGPFNARMLLSQIDALFEAG